MCALIDAYLENTIEPLGPAPEQSALRIGVREVVDWAVPAVATPISYVAEMVGARRGSFGSHYSCGGIGQMVDLTSATNACER
jgi:hypothetical protein